MKTVNYVPSVCQGDAATWKGSILLRLPTFEEKFEYIEKMGINVDKDGDVESDKMTQVKSIRSLVKLSSAHYLEVNLSKLDGSEDVKSYDDMQYVEELHAVLIEIASKILNGFKVGNG